MNRADIIGNLTRDPEVKTVTTKNGETTKCTFTIAVNNRRRGSNEQNDATFFRITAWGSLGANCAKYLTKGKRCWVTGEISASAYLNKNGEAACSIEIKAEDIEFLSPADQTRNSTFAQNNAEQVAPVAVQTDELPF